MSIDSDIEEILALLRKKLKLKNLQTELRILSAATHDLSVDEYFNFDELEYDYTVYLDVPIELFVELEDQISEIEASILREARSLRRESTGEHFGNVRIRVAPETRPRGIPLVVEDDDSIWDSGGFKLFLSHVSSQKGFAHELKEALRRYNITAFVAHDDIEPTAEWQQKIESALNSMDALAAILSDDFVNSPWCDQETGIAMGLGRLVVPVSIEANPHGFLSKYQRLNGMGRDASQIATGICETLSRHEATQARMAVAHVELFKASNSYAQARARMSLLERMQFMTPEIAQSLRSAAQENDQITDAYGVPERLEKLLSELGFSSED